MKVIEITDMSDVSPPPPGDYRAGPQVPRLQGVVQAVTPPVVISLMTVVIHMAALKYIFLSIF